MEIINEQKITEAIYSDIGEIFQVDRNTRVLTPIRYGLAIPGIDSYFGVESGYDRAVEAYLTGSVVEEDRDKLRKFLNFDELCGSLEKQEAVSMFYRAFTGDKIRFVRLRCARVGTAEEFRSLVLVFEPEEFDKEQIRMLCAVETDSITGVLTREAFIYRAARFLEEHPEQAFDLLATDVDNFKRVNSLHGREAGDKVLKYLAECYGRLSEFSVLGRIEGGKFALLLPALGEDGLAELNKNIERIREEAPIQHLTIHYGMNSNVDRRDSVVDMLDKAILALRSHSSLHDEPISFYNSEVIRKHLRAQTFELEFEEALEEKQFIVLCQPQYSATDRKIVAGEALVRWRNGEGEVISPGEFIPVFEGNGLIARLDEYVFRTVCRKQKEQMEAGKVPLPVSVNMSRVSLFRSGGAARYSEIIEEIGIPKRLVPIEITESATVEEEQIGDLINELKTAGFPVHMDDFGSGYSSLSNLSSLQFDAVKLDKSLVDGIGTPKGEELIRHLIGMAHFFSMEVIAEGVERKPQYSFLKKLGCDTIQGYYFSRPVSFDEFLTMCGEQMAARSKTSGIKKTDEADNAEKTEDGTETGKKENGVKRKLKRIRSVFKTYWGEQNDIYRANAFALDCLWMSLLVLAACWILDLLNIFIVDLRIMNTALAGAAIVFFATWFYAKFIGIDRPASRYVILLAMVVFYSFIFTMLAYHATLVMVFPLFCAMMYFDRKVTFVTYGATCIGYGAAVLLGYRFGLCDSNMLLLTYTDSAAHAAFLQAGNFEINSDLFKMFLFFVFPRWALLLSILPILSHVASDIQSRTKREAKIRHMAEIDGLTGLYNRYKYVQSINSFYPGCSHVAVLYCDINNLKKINDSRGHECGDRLILGLSEELQKQESEHCKAYRTGGDEFVMILEGSEANRVRSVREELCRVLRQKVVDGDVQLSVAVGSASGAGEDIEKVINHADEDMYREKEKMKAGEKT